MAQDFYPPLIVGVAPIEGALDVSRAPTFHITCVDVETGSLNIGSLGVKVSVDPIPPEPGNPNNNIPQPEQVIHGGILQSTYWDSFSSIDANAAESPTQVNIYLRREFPFSYGDKVLIEVSIDDAATNSSLREINYTVRDTPIYEGDTPVELELSMIIPFQSPVVEEFREGVLRTLTNPAGISQEKLPLVSSRRALTILSRLNMGTVAKLYWEQDPDDIASETAGSLPLKEVLKNYGPVMTSYSNLARYLSTRTALVPEGYMELIKDSQRKTEPFSVIGSYIALLIILCTRRSDGADL